MMSQIERLKELYGDAYNEKDLIQVFDCKRNPFYMIGSSLEDVSILEGGYIITPDGKFIKVLDGQDHDSVFSLYINNYLGKPGSNELYGSAECSKILNNFNHIVYYGIKVGYLQAINNPKYEVLNYLKEESIAKMSRGLGVLSFPKNEDITNEQRLSCHKLLFTNLKSIQNTYKKIVDVSYGNIEINRTYNSEQLDDLLTIDLLETIDFNAEQIKYFIKQFKKMLEIEDIKLDNIQKEYEIFKEKTNQNIKDSLKERYDAINNSNISTIEKGKLFQELFKTVRNYDDLSIYKYMVGEHIKLEQSMYKVTLKINRYLFWKQYLEELSFVKIL